MLTENPRPDLGTLAADFRLMDAAGAVFSRDDLKGPNGLLVGFICNHCPYVIGLAGRLGDDMRTLAAQGINTVLINSNDYLTYASDAPEHMPGFAAKHGLDAPYLIDETQDIARAYGAVCTPDFFGYDGGLRLKYRGRLDDGGRGAAEDRTPELRNAMLAADLVEPQVPSMGCSIKWRRP